MKFLFKYTRGLTSLVAALGRFDSGWLAADRAILHDGIDFFCAIAGHLDKGVCIEYSYRPYGFAGDTGFTGYCTYNVLWGDIVVSSKAQKEPHHAGLCTGISEINRGVAFFAGFRALLHAQLQKSGGDLKR